MSLITLLEELKLKFYKSISFVNHHADSRVAHIKASLYPDNCCLQMDQLVTVTDTKAIETVIKNSPYLEDLHIPNLTPDLLETIVNQCPQIKGLQFEDIIGDLSDVWCLDKDDLSKSLSSVPARKKAKRAKNIDKLNNLRMLICPYHVKEVTLSLLLANCPNLETLIICFAEEGKTNHGITGNCFKYFGKNIKHLIFGNLAFKNDIVDNLFRSNGRSAEEIEILFPILEHRFDKILEFTNLRKLTIKASKCDFDQIKNLSKLINLESLVIERLEDRWSLLEDLFTPIFQKCSKLREFKVSGVFGRYTDRLFEIICENNLLLTHLHILPNMYKPFIDYDQMDISSSIDNLISMKNLRSLALPYTNLTDDHLDSLLLSCPQLTVIDLSNCKSMNRTDHIMNAAKKNPDQNYSVYFCSNNMESLPELPNNLKLCICDCQRSGWLSLIPKPFYNLI